MNESLPITTIKFHITMKKTIIITTLILTVSVQIWAQKTAIKFGYSWEYPSDWDKEKMDADEIFLTPTTERKTITFITIKSFDIRDENVRDEVWNFMMQEIGTDDKETIKEAEVTYMQVDGDEAAYISGSYLDDDFEFTDFRGLFILRNDKRVIAAFDSVYDGGDMDEAIDRLAQVEAILQSAKKAN